MDNIIEFTLAALPFILIGLSVIIACVNKNKDISQGMVLGMGLGIAIGSAIDYLALSMAAGMFLGEIIAIKKIK